MKMPRLTPPKLVAFFLWIGTGLAQTNACPVGNLAPARPLGIYAIVNIDTVIQQNPSADLSALYAALLSNPAVSGLALVVHWSTLDNAPGVGGYQWAHLDDAFNQVTLWNGNNPSAPPKTIQLTVTPGFGTPTWALDRIAPSCDGLFQPSGTAPDPCG